MRKTGRCSHRRRIQENARGCPEGLERFYTHKDLGFIIESGTLEDIADDRIIGIIRKNFKAFSPMYLYLLDIVEEYNSEVKE